MVGEVLDANRYDELRGRPRPYARHGQQAPVGAVLPQQRRDLPVEAARLRARLADPPREHLDLRVLGRDHVLGRPGGGLGGGPGGVEGGAVAAAGGGAERPLAGVEDPPGAAEGLQGRQPAVVGEVGERLEGRAGLQQHAAQAVLVAGGAGDHVVPLGGERPRRLQPPVGLRGRQQGVGDAECGLGDDRRVALVGLGLAREEPGGAVGGGAGQVGDREPGEPGAPERERADVAGLVDDDQRAGRDPRHQRVEVGLAVGDGAVDQDLAGPGDEAGPVRRLADVQAEHRVGRGRFFDHGGILPIESFDRKAAPRDTHITWPWRSWRRARQFPISRPGTAAPASATPPGPSRGRGRRPSAGARSAVHSDTSQS